MSAKVTMISAPAAIRGVNPEAVALRDRSSSPLEYDSTPFYESHWRPWLISIKSDPATETDSTQKESASANRVVNPGTDSTPKESASANVVVNPETDSTPKEATSYSPECLRPNKKSQPKATSHQTLEDLRSLI
jgi:hypothetical protein